MTKKHSSQISYQPWMICTGRIVASRQDRPSKMSFQASSLEEIMSKVTCRRPMKVSTALTLPPADPQEFPITHPFSALTLNGSNQKGFPASPRRSHFQTPWTASPSATSAKPKLPCLQACRCMNMQIAFEREICRNPLHPRQLADSLLKRRPRNFPALAGAAPPPPARPPPKSRQIS